MAGQFDRTALEQIARSNSRRRRIRWLIAASALTILVVWTTVSYVRDPYWRRHRDISSESPDRAWSMYRHDLGRTGADSPAPPGPAGKIRWRFATGAAVHSSPAVVDGTVYVGSRDSRLYAIDAATGLLRWEYHAAGWIDTSPVVVGDMVYFGTNASKLRALSTRDGSEIWSFSTSHAVYSSPAVADGTVYFGTDSHLYGVDAMSGKLRWQISTTEHVISSPVVFNGVVYVGSNGPFVYAVRARDGRSRLHFKAFGVRSSPAVQEGVVYFVNRWGVLYAVDAAARNWPMENTLSRFFVRLWMFSLLPRPPRKSGLLWTLELGDAGSSPAVTADTLYVGSGNRLVAVDIHQRRTRWAAETDGPVTASPAVGAGAVYTGSEDGILYAVDRETGAVRWEVPTGGPITSSPALAAGVVYVGSHDGHIYAIE